MATRSVFGLLGRKAAAAGVAGAGVAASQPAAHAREAVHVAAAPAPATSRAGQVLDDDWLETHFEGQEVLVFRSFRPDEVDQAVASVQSALELQQGKGAATRGMPSLVSVRAPLTVEEDGDAGACSGVRRQRVSDPPSPSTETEGSVSGEAATAVLGEPLLLARAEEQEQGEQGLSSVAATGAAAAAMSQSAMSDLLQISRKLLTRPGLQREVFKCMVEDPEVRELMLRQSRNLDLYLQATGITVPAGLITDAEGGDSAEGLRLRLPASMRARVRGGDGQQEGREEEEEQGARRAGGQGEGRGGQGDLLERILDAVATCIDSTGSFLAGLGGWLRGRFLELGMLLGGAFGLGGHAGAEEEDEEEEGKGAARRGRSAGDMVLGAAMVVTVALFCVLLARNPRLVAGAAAAAAGTAAEAKRRQAAGLGPTSRA